MDKVLDTFTETKTVQTYEKILFQIRGLPGSEKSTLARKIADEVYENNDCFSFGGVYKFSQEKLLWAKAEYHKNCRDAMEREVAKITVANTFIDEADWEPYHQLAEIFGYTVFYVVCENWTGNRNIHGVTEQSLKNMRKNIRVRL